MNIRNRFNDPDTDIGGPLRNFPETNRSAIVAARSDGQAVIVYVCTVDVASVDGSTKTVESNGGQVVVPKMPIPGVGWLVYCKDTEGNIFGMMQSDANAN